jgi:hypothetical protein
MNTLRSLSPITSVLIAASALLSACSESGTVTVLPARPSVALELPRVLFDAPSIDQDNLRPQVTLSNGDTVSMQQLVNSGSWSGTINVVPSAQYVVTVTWLERLEGFDGRELPLAQLTQDWDVAADGTVVQTNTSGYSTDLDEDGDNRSNFEERQSGSNPFVNDEQGDGASTAADPPVNGDEPAEATTPVTADLVVPRIASSSAPLIDGQNVTINSQDELTGEWSAAIQVDNSGAPLTINNLIIDVDADVADGTPHRRWAAMHDGEYLYVLVLVDDDGQRERDSAASLINDDSLEIFLDGDNSKSQSYGIDDFHRIVPGRLAGADKQSASTGDIAGPNSSAAELLLDFATGPGMGPDGIRRFRFEQDVYEIRIQLESANIDTDAPFGFELQVNDDDDGNTRDAKWAWKHVSSQGADIDDTISNPSLMGTVLLE